LDAKGVPGEIVGEWAMREAKVLSSPCSSRSWNGHGVGQPLPPQVRGACLRFLHRLTDLVGMPADGWWSAVLLLDLYVLRAEPAPEAVPAACAAVVSLLRKSDKASFRPQWSDFTLQASQLAQWLRSLRFPTRAEVTISEILVQEKNIIEALDWQINCPSVHVWMSALRERFSILSNGAFTTLLDWVFQASLQCASMLVTSRPTTASLPPQRVANGLFCLNLVAASLVPLEALRPDKVGKTEWEMLFMESQGQGAVPHCGMPSEHQTKMVELLGLMTRCGPPSLQADAYEVAVTMRDIYSEMRVASTSWTCRHHGPRIPSVV